MQLDTASRVLAVPAASCAARSEVSLFEASMARLCSAPEACNLATRCRRIAMTTRLAMRSDRAYTAAFTVSIGLARHAILPLGTGQMLLAVEHGAGEEEEPPSGH
jgi:hypothetical protein